MITTISMTLERCDVKYYWSLCPQSISICFFLLSRHCFFHGCVSFESIIQHKLARVLLCTQTYIHIYKARTRNTRSMQRHESVYRNVSLVLTKLIGPKTETSKHHMHSIYKGHIYWFGHYHLNAKKLLCWLCIAMKESVFWDDDDDNIDR